MPGAPSKNPVAHSDMPSSPEAKASATRRVARVSRDRLRADVERHGSSLREYYALGEARTENEKVKKMRKKSPQVLVGSVDSTRFRQIKRSAAWYEAYFGAAASVMLLEDKFDDPTKEWFNRLKPLLKGLSEVKSSVNGTIGLSEFYYKEVGKLVKIYGADGVYGEKGVFNFLLGFRRVRNLCNNLDNVEKIKIVLGSGVGVAKGKKHRYAYMVVAPRRSEKHEPKSVPSPKPKPEPKPKDESEPEPKERKGLEFGGEEFCAKYGINDSSEFKGYVDSLRGRVTDSLISDLESDEFWNNKQGESNRDADSRFMGLFRDKGRGYRKLFVDLSEMKDNFPTWFKKADDSVSKRYVRIYYLLIKRLIEFTNKYERDSRAKKDELLEYHRYIWDMRSSLLRSGDKNMREQLKSSLDFLKTYAPDGEKAKWQAEYRKL